jgi:hypothetical protein
VPLLAALGCQEAPALQDEDDADLGDTSTFPDTGTHDSDKTTGDDSNGDLTDEDESDECVPDLPPAGPNCGCTWSDCMGCALTCTCAESCASSPGSCMISAVDGKVVVNHPQLSTWNFSCTLIPANDEFPGHLTCEGVDPFCGEDDDSTSEDTSTATSSTDEDSTTSDDETTIPDDACPIKVPGATVLAGPVWGEYQIQFAIPFVDWGFAVAHAASLLDEAKSQGHAADLSPSFYLATALKESFMGCSVELPPYDAFQPGRIVQREASYYDGCFQIESTTAWTEMCRMFSDEFDCAAVGHNEAISSANQATLGRDNFASSALVKSYYDTLSFSMIYGKHGVAQVGQWLASAADPDADAKLVAVLYNKGPWSQDIDAILAGCHDDLLEKCMVSATDYPIQIAQYTRALEYEVKQGNCYNPVITRADVESYVARIAFLFRGVDPIAVTQAAADAFDKVANGSSSVDFQVAAGPVLAAIDRVISARPHCPAAELKELYQIECE